MTADDRATGADVPGRVRRVAGPLVVAEAMRGSRMYDVVRVGALGLMGEVIRLEGEMATIQVYEDTSGLRVGDAVRSTGGPLLAELGPGLLGSVFDGLQRPLPGMLGGGDPYVARGLHPPALDRTRRWPFEPRVAAGHRVGPGGLLGVTREGELEHRVLAPPGVAGTVVDVRCGELGVDDGVAWVRSDAGGVIECRLAQPWPVRRPRPHGGKLDPGVPLWTGQRVIDVFFPIAKGGTAVIPGGFGTGKTVIEQTLARWADADVVVYVGCGERGNEMAEVLAEFPRLQRGGASLMERTVLVANTSNMPVAAREASIYLGVTISEYYRDMGYDVALLVDSTSRWAEALREISSRLEELPGEEGYPAYLSSRVAALYERGGRVRCPGVSVESGAERAEPPEPNTISPGGGSVTIIGAVSPPGGDFSEPMTQASLRVAGTFWALDRELAHRRHFPAINWTQSYSLYLSHLGPWYRTRVAPDWGQLRARAMALLEEEEELQAIVQLVGVDALPAEQRAVLAVARVLEEDFLRQSAYHPEDAFCPPDKAYALLRGILGFDELLREVMQRGAELAEVLELPEVSQLARLKELPAADASTAVDRLLQELPRHLAAVTPDRS